MPFQEGEVEAGQPVPNVERREGETTEDYLRRLEESGEYLFHGSSQKIDELEPRDPVADASDNPDNKRVAVYAFSSPALATQFAIIQSKHDVKEDWNIIGGTDSENSDRPLLRTTPNLKLGKGYVHVLPRQQFTLTEGYQWICEKPIRPIEAVEVDPEIYGKLGGEHRTIKG